MSVSHVTAVRDGIVDYVVDLIDAGSGNPTGELIIMTSGDVEVATLTFSNPAFFASSSAVATADTITSDLDATGGTAALFKAVDRDSGEVFRGSVGAVGSGADIILSSTSIGAGDTVSISAFTYTGPN